MYFRENLGQDVVKEFRKRIDVKKLRSYLQAYPPRFQGQVEFILKLIKKRNR